MRTSLHIAAAVTVCALAAAAARAQFSPESIQVSQATTASLKTKHKWKTTGGGGDGSATFLPFVDVSPDEFGAEVSGSVEVQEQGATREQFFLIVHAGKGSRDRDSRYRAKVGKGDGALGLSFGAVLSDLVYALDLSLPQSSGVVGAKAVEAIDGAVDITSSKGQLDLRERGPSTVDVKFKAVYRGTVIFGPRAGKKVKGKILMVAKEAARDT